MEIFSNLFLFFKGGHIYGTLSDHLLWSFFISIPDQASPSEEHHNWWLQVCWQPLCGKNEEVPPPPGGGAPKKKTSRSWDRWRTNVPQSFHNIFHTVKDGELHPSLQIISLRSWPFYDYTINPFPQPTNLNHLALRQPIPINLLIHMRI